MRTSRVIAAMLCGGLFYAAPVSAQKTLKPALEGAKPGEWTLDFEAAKTAAAEKNMPILLFKTRDACGLCSSAKQQLFSQPAWTKFAKDNLFLVWVDLPFQGKSGAGIPEKYQDMEKTVAKFFSGGGGSLPVFAVVDADGETPLGSWNGVDFKKPVEYFCDLVKSHMLLGAPKPAAAPAAKKPAGPAPAVPPPGTIKPALEGARLGEWTMDFEAAQKYAADNDSILLLYFTGSDWNRQSKAANKAIFARPGFDKYAANNNILLVWVDFPENPSLVPEKFAEQNKTLRKAYVPKESFPACVLLASDGAMKLASFDKTLPALTMKEFQDGIKPHIPKKKK